MTAAPPPLAWGHSGHFFERSAECGFRLVPNAIGDGRDAVRAA